MVAGEPMAAALPLARTLPDGPINRYICRQMAKSVVASGLSGRRLVQLSYTINVARPQSVFMGTYGSEKDELSVDDVTNVLRSSSTAGRVLSLSRWRCGSPRVRRLLKAATWAASQRSGTTSRFFKWKAKDLRSTPP